MGISPKQLLPIIILKAIVDFYTAPENAPGKPPRVSDLFEKGNKTGGMVNEFWRGTGFYRMYPFGEAGTPYKEWYIEGWIVGQPTIEAFQKLADLGLITERGIKNVSRKPYMPTEAGIAFVQGLPADWREWQLPSP